MVHENSLKALVANHCKPGENRNPNGRRAGDVVRGALLDFLKLPHKSRDYSRLDAIVRTLYAKALTGDVPALKLLLSYIEAPPASTSSATLERDGLGRVIVTWAAAAGAADPDAGALLNLPVTFTQARGCGFAEFRGLRTARHTYVRSIHGPWLLYDNRQALGQDHAGHAADHRSSAAR
ncbi:MAG: DUF5681 domain-containing protein [bacterium]|nr:DUF5681 domain-containing protein [bacterium]